MYRKYIVNSDYYSDAVVIFFNLYQCKDSIS